MKEKKRRNQYDYDKKAYDHIHLQAQKGKREEYKMHAAGRGESLNGFIIRAIRETMERDNEKRPED